MEGEPVPTLSWTRHPILAQQWTSVLQKSLLVQLSSGQSIVRNHISWSFGGHTSTTIVPTTQLGNAAALGLVTTIGNGTETPPDPFTAPFNASPPARRWLYWSLRRPTITAWDATGGVVTFESTPPEEEGSTEGQVLAPTGMGSGNFLNLWMVWNTVAVWDPSGQAVLTCGVSTLVKTPL